MGKYLDIAKQVPRKPKRKQAELDHQAKEIAKVFQERGWVAFSSRLLNGEVVVFVRDEKVAIPARWQDAVRYTLAELEALVKPPKPVPEELKQLHEAKKVFEGRIEGIQGGMSKGAAGGEP